MTEFADRYFPFMLAASTLLLVIGLVVGIFFYLATAQFGVAVLLSVILAYICYVIVAGFKLDGVL